MVTRDDIEKLGKKSGDNYFCGAASDFSDQKYIEKKLGSLIPCEDITKELCYLIQVPSETVCTDQLSLEITDPHTRLIISFEKGTKASVSITINPHKSGATHVTEIFLEDEAECTVLFHQNSNAERLHINQKSSVGSGAKLQIQNASLGGHALIHNLVSEVHGERGESSIDWVFYAKGTEQQRISARNIFHAENGGGEIAMKGVAEEQAHTECNGMIDIELGGKGTDTYLNEHVLMLDKTAKVDATPALEIKTNDVKASHSATVSKVTDENLFYFATRGVPEDQARQMYVLGFLGDLTQKISSESGRNSVLESIEKKYRKR